MILVTGEIPRKTEFEKGFPQHRVFDGGKWQPDPWIWDDRAIAINIKKKGLVVVSGCAHAGIINTVLYAQQIAGVTDIYAVIGGFHLAGKECEPRIRQTVEQLKLLDPKFLAPSHCTGWRGIHAVAEALPHAFVWNSVGNLYRF
jgi:7,8-dihydropterin-6-yl-methyl-4-(beta-D-ribofuranosyl)aminobenzene 5'-phosphate synthase